jgi:hypothetical protein
VRCHVKPDFGLALRCLGRIAVLLAAIVGTSVSARAADAVWSTQRLMALKPEWERLMNTPLRVEGRVATSAKNQLRLAKCDLAFHLSDDQGRMIGNAKNLELQGRILRDTDSGRLYFDVTSLKPLSTDADQFLSREAALKNPKADAWYALGEWAEERGKFYEDMSLTESARLCFTRGLALDMRELAKDDVEGRFQLAAEARDLGLPHVLSDEVRHEAYRTWWTRTTVSTPSADDLAALLKRVSVDWPNSVSALSAWPTELQEAYAQDPLGTYRHADAAQRTVLQRLFTAQVQLRQIVAAAASDGKNGGEIAAQIERFVPERKALAEHFRDQALRYRHTQVASATKAEAVQLADAFRERRRDDLAVDTLRRWLSARAQKIAKTGGAPEYLALADDYWSLLKDEQTTVALLEAAREREPESEDVQSRYRELGYEWTGDRWTKPTAPPAESATPGAPPSPKSLDVGLTTAEVRQIQGGPTRVATLVSAGSIDEFWTYGEPNGSRLVIQFTRRLHQNELKVVKIFQR